MARSPVRAIFVKRGIAVAVFLVDVGFGVEQDVEAFGLGAGRGKDQRSPSPLGFAPLLISSLAISGSSFPIGR